MCVCVWSLHDYHRCIFSYGFQFRFHRMTRPCTSQYLLFHTPRFFQQLKSFHHEQYSFHRRKTCRQSINMASSAVCNFEFAPSSLYERVTLVSFRRYSFILVIEIVFRLFDCFDPNTLQRFSMFKCFRADGQFLPTHYTPFLPRTKESLSCSSLSSSCFIKHNKSKFLNRNFDEAVVKQKGRAPSTI